MIMTIQMPIPSAIFDVATKLRILQSIQTKKAQQLLLDEKLKSVILEGSVVYK
jgi:hypothetical protein